MNLQNKLNELSQLEQRQVSNIQQLRNQLAFIEQEHFKTVGAMQIIQDLAKLGSEESAPVVHKKRGRKPKVEAEKKEVK